MKQHNNVLLLPVYTLVSLVSAASEVTKPISSFPKWQQVFINYTTWNGHYSYNNTIHVCRMGIHSVDKDVIASFVDSDTHMDLKGYSILDTVIFNKTLIYQSNERFQGSFQLVGKLTWSDNTGYWMYTANVTIPKGKPFSQFTFMSNSDITNTAPGSSKTKSIILGVVLTTAVVGVILMGGTILWSYRKGLLRHIPMSYSTFKNPQEERRASFDSREETVHI